MKNKLLIFVVLCSLMIPSLSASEIDSQPNWINISYADLEHQYTTEYQAVNITVSQKGLWWKNYNSQLEIEYDQSALELVNTVYYDPLMNGTSMSDPNITTTDSSFQVTYQFILKNGYDLQSTPVSFTKTVNDKVSTGMVTIDTHSETMMSNYKFGDVVIGYSVDQYTNDAETITYNAHFKVVSNPKNTPFTLTLKSNNMDVDSTDSYEAKLRYTTGVVEAIDKNNFKIDIPEGDTFDLNITAQIEGLSAKDDRFEFLIFLSDGENFTRIEPTMFRSELITPDNNKRGDRFVIIKMLIALFFAFLAVVHFVSSKSKKKVLTTKSKKMKKEEPKS